MKDTLTFRECAPILRANGYAPCAARPEGPIAVYQINHGKFVRDEHGLGVLCFLPPATSADPWMVKDHESTWLAAVVVNVSADVSKDVGAVLTKYVGKARAVIRGKAGCEQLYLFKTSARLKLSANTYSAGAFRVEQEPVAISGHEWSNDLFSTARADLPELTAKSAAALIAEAEAVFLAHAPKREHKSYVPRTPATERRIKLTRGNEDEVLAALAENGYSAITCAWGDEEPRRKNGGTSPAVGVYLREPANAGFFTAATWLVMVRVKCGSKVEHVYEELFSRLPSDGRRVERIDADGSRVLLFQHDAAFYSPRPFQEVNLTRPLRDGPLTSGLGRIVTLSVQCERQVVVVLGPDIEWRDGISPVNVRRDELPHFTSGHATNIEAAYERLKGR